jgi:L-lactate dehydrogenase complex protein LldE
MTSRATPPATRPARKRVYFFATCVVDAMAPGAGMDSIELIRAAGISVEFPQAQSCCGQPAYTSGYTDEARQVAAAQLDLFPAALAHRRAFGVLRRHAGAPLAAAFCRRPCAAEEGRGHRSRVVEFSEFAVTVLGLAAPAGALQPAPRLADAPVRTPIKVALHTSCSGRREMGTHLPSRALLAQLPGVELVDFARDAECCGFGGTFSARHPAISGAMVQDKLQAVRDAGATRAGQCRLWLPAQPAPRGRESKVVPLPASRAACTWAASCANVWARKDAAQQVTD